jgi:hypothetical protein
MSGIRSWQLVAIARFAASLGIVVVGVGCGSNVRTESETVNESAPASSPSAAASPPCTGEVLPSTSAASAHYETRNTVIAGTLPLVFSLTPEPAALCSGDEVVVSVTIANQGSEPVDGFQSAIVTKCGAGPPFESLVVGSIGPIDIPPNQDTHTTVRFTVPLSGPGLCSFAVDGYGNGGELTVLAHG